MPFYSSCPDLKGINGSSLSYIKDQISATAEEITDPEYKDLSVWEKNGVEKEGFAMEWSGLGDHANPNADHILACIVNHLCPM